MIFPLKLALAHYVSINVELKHLVDINKFLAIVKCPENQMAGDDMKRVLFICTHNSARSQMAEGLVNALYSKVLSAKSAGTKPGTIHPLAIEVMAELDIDISTQRSKGLIEFKEQEFDYVVMVCSNAAETCPFFPGVENRSIMDSMIHQKLWALSKKD